MLANFRRTFKPTDEERAHDRAVLERLHAKAVESRSCSACMFSHVESNGHYSWMECDVTGEDVDGNEGMDCWTEQPLPDDATI